MGVCLHNLCILGEYFKVIGPGSSKRRPLLGCSCNREVLFPSCRSFCERAVGRQILPLRSFSITILTFQNIKHESFFSRFYTRFSPLGKTSSTLPTWSEREGCFNQLSAISPNPKLFSTDCHSI